MYAPARVVLLYYYYYYTTPRQTAFLSGHACYYVSTHQLAHVPGVQEELPDEMPELRTVAHSPAREWRVSEVEVGVTCIHAFACTHAFTHSRTHAFTHSRTHARTRARMHARTYARACMHTHVCIHMDAVGHEDEQCCIHTASRQAGTQRSN